MPFYKQGASGMEHTKGRQGDVAAIDQLWCATDPDQPAPGPASDKGTQTCFAEIIREGIPAGSAPAIDQHHFGPEITGRGPIPGGAVAGSPEGQGLAIEQFDIPVRDLPPAIALFFDHQCLFIQLCRELTDQFILPVGTLAAYIDITGNPASDIV